MSVATWIEEVRRQLGRAGVRGALENISWLTGERVLQLGVGMVVGVWVARVLGPERFGLYSYALAFATLFGAGANLGTDTVVVRDLVRHPERAETIVGTSLRLRAAGALATMVVLAVVAIAVYRHERVTLALILAFGLTTASKPFDVVDLWFQAKTQLLPGVRARSVAFLTGSAGRVAVLLAADGAVLALAIVEPLAAALAALLLVRAFHRSAGGLGVVGRWERGAAVEILRESWPMLVAAMGVILYMRVDQVMIENLGGAGGTHEVGLYSAALRLSEAFYMIPTAVVTALFPHIVQSRAEGSSVYAARLGRLFSTMTALALGVAIPMTFLARPIVAIVFGADYAGAAPILAVHVWTTVFVFWGVVGSAWMVNEGLTRVAPIRSFQGAAVNVLLNLWLIPRYGGLGAAVATLVSQAFAASLLHLGDARTRPLFLMQARSLLLGGLLR